MSEYEENEEAEESGLAGIDFALCKLPPRLATCLLILIKEDLQTDKQLARVAKQELIAYLTRENES